MRISDWSSDVCSSDLQIDRNHHPVGPARVVVKLARDQLLAGAVFAEDQDIGLGRGGAFDEGKDAGDGRRTPKQRSLAAGDRRRDGNGALALGAGRLARIRSEEHTSELQSLMRISYAVFCLKKKTKRYYYLEQSTRQT